MMKLMPTSGTQFTGRLAIASVLAALPILFTGSSGAATKAEAKVSAPRKSIASKYTKTTRAAVEVANPKKPVASKYTKIVTTTIVSNSNDLPSGTTTVANPVLNTSIATVTITDVPSAKVAQGQTTPASTPVSTTVAIVLQWSTNPPSTTVLPVSFTLDENSPGLIWCGTSNDPDVDPRRGTIVGTTGSCPSGTFRLPARRAVKCFRENGSSKESFSVGPGQTCQSLGFQGECSDDTCSNANVATSPVRTEPTGVSARSTFVSNPTINPVPVSTKASASTPRVTATPATQTPAIQPLAVTYPTTRPTLAVTTTTISFQLKRARCLELRGRYDYELAEQQQLKTVVIPAAYARQRAASGGGTDYNLAQAEVKRSEALLKISEGRALAIKDELDKIWGACP
jgi:hypothetical protein